jgi:hypothetical protein
MQRPYPQLPALAEGELATLFGDDADALRRYRLLRAVLLEGKPQLMAAREFGVSERTVRNILNTYRTGAGLDGLRSRNGSTPRSRTRRGDLFDWAVAAALDEEPLAGGDRLWRRAQELLSDSGTALSRRTTYRILARLRKARPRHEPANGALSQVRAALALMAEDPPMTLSTSVLAQVLLPGETDQLQRALLLQQALRMALDRLRPSGEAAPFDRNWWPYLICIGEYEEGRPRSALQQELALSASTYSRAKRQALLQIANSLPRIVGGLVETPRVGQNLPRTSDVVGRRREQTFYAAQLEESGLAWIWGIPGNGKTALAAELAAESRRSGLVVLWHTCRPGTDATLAAAVVGFMQNLPDASSSPAESGLPGDPVPDATVLIEQLWSLLRDRPSLLVLDDVHHLSQADLAELADVQLRLGRRHSSQLLLVGRTQPPVGNWSMLPGLVDDEARLLWDGLPHLPEEHWRLLYEASAGLPGPLRLAVAAYRRNGNGAQVDVCLAEVWAWTEEMIWARLSEPEQRVLIAAYALEESDLAANAALLLAALEIDSGTLERICAQGLATTADGRIVPHPVLRVGAISRLRADTRLGSLRNSLAAVP